MRIVEDRHPGEPWLLWKLGNATAVDSTDVLSVGVAWIFRENGAWVLAPRVVDEVSLFYNAVVFIRLTVTIWMIGLMAALICIFQSALPLALLLLGVFASFRWSGSTTERALLQSGLGWKLNGRFGVILRAQSDASSAAGSTGPNYGQASGFDYGTH